MRALLDDGPRNSRDVLTALAALQFTPKQARRAREQLGVLTERAGNGKAMHSTWRLPDGKATAARNGRNPGAANHPEQGTPAGQHLQPPADVSEGEQRRHRARVAAFLALGHDTTTASAVADALVARDRAGRPAEGSCAECQNLARRQCPATPRPAIEIHECWARRQGTP